MSTTDRVSHELRKVEREIDNHYKSNPLVNLPFATAAWYFLAYSECYLLRQMEKDLTSQQSEMMIDNLLNTLKHPMFWIFDECKPEGRIPTAFDNNMFEASSNLWGLGWEYGWFDTAYRYASNGWVGLELQGSTIQPTEELFRDQKYKAYNYLIKAHESDETLPLIDLDSFHLLEETIRRSVRVKGNRFTYNFNPKMIDEAINIMNPIYDKAFPSPRKWKFGRYSLEDYRRVFEAISAMASIHFRARMIAINMGCRNRAYLDSIFLPKCDGLVNRVISYSDVSKEKVQSILDDLTYGNRGVKNPDPALQPIIKLNSRHYAIVPHLWLSSAPERNLAVLLNKIPSERDIYAKIVGEQEKLMQDHFITNLLETGFRVEHGSVANLPDIDLAIVNDSEKSCLLLEFKWFINPAEIREVIDKSEAIKKGISQVLEFKHAFSKGHKGLSKKLKIGPVTDSKVLLFHRIG